MDFQYLLAAANIRQADHHLAVKTARTEQRLVQHVGAVGSGNYDYALVALKPSISTSNWLSVCSRSSWPPPWPPPRWRPTASISSIKMMHGACFLAWSNISRTREAPTPTNISTKSEPEMEKNGTLASPAMALANRVLPVPGAPAINTPRGMVPPSF